jgi:7-cyano-7-deazaguanine synthase in queuosine biosynthesis
METVVVAVSNAVLASLAFTIAVSANVLAVVIAALDVDWRLFNV